MPYVITIPSGEWYEAEDCILWDLDKEQFDTINQAAGDNARAITAAVFENAEAKQSPIPGYASDMLESLEEVQTIIAGLCKVFGVGQVEGLPFWLRALIMQD